MADRAAMLLSRNRLREATELARDALAADLTRAPDLQIQLQLVLGLALAGAGDKSEGIAKCAAARAAAEAGRDTVDALYAAAALLETRIGRGDPKAALEVFTQIEPSLATHPELQWRVLALASLANPRYIGRARESLQKLSLLWGDSAYTKYLTRPDVGKLSRPLLPLVPALH